VIIKELSQKLESLEKEKLLADKVTGELLQRIQRYEQEINEYSKKTQIL
jgi:hypothetical protein